MRRIGGVLACLFLAIAAIWAFAPDEPVDRQITFDASALPDDLDGWLAAEEQQFSDIRPGTAKRIVWAGAKGEKTPLAVVYLHGFSASAEEIRPVPDAVAKALGANLFYTRLAGHGRTSAAMAEPVAGDWIEDMAEAMAIGRRLGKRVLILSTSTGGTLAALAAVDPDLREGLAGVVFVSPNFGLKGAAGVLLDLPLVRYWGPLVAGAEQGFTPKNAGQAAYWTTSYPTVALMPMAALVRVVRALDFGAVRAPALFIYTAADQVVDPERTAAVAAAWGGPKEVFMPVLGPGDDRYSHVIAGAIMSPGQTEAVVARITLWARGL